MYKLLLLITVLAATLIAPVLQADEPQTKEQRDARMAWWREARFGMFIHWGVYSVPAGVWNGRPVEHAGEWIMHNAKIPVAEYKPLASQFDPTDFDANAWVSLAKASGMKYIVITAKHHDGFAMFHSQADPFNIYDATPFKRDPLKELAKACQTQGIKLGFYYSQDQDWTAPGGANLVGSRWDKAQDGDFAQYLETKAIPQMEELLTNYQPAPAVIWFDTPTVDMTPELAGQIVALLQKHPDIIWNNRLGGGFQGDTETPEQTIPARGFPNRDWETCTTINNTWGYKSADTNFKSTATLLQNLIDIASKGGNYLLNVGPTSKGVIPQPEADRLMAIGKWLDVNGEAIYGTTPGPLNRTPAWGRVTQKPGKLYLSVFDWPKDGKLSLAVSNQVTKAYLLAQPDTALTTTTDENGVTVNVPATAPDPITSVVVLEIQGPPVLLSLSQASDGTITLTPEDAEIEGNRLRVEHTPPNLGFWTNEQDFPHWNIQVKNSGKFKVAVNYALHPSGRPSVLTLKVGTQTLSIPVPATASWEDYRKLEAGTITVTGDSAQNFTLTGKKGGAAAVANLRNITLTPVPAGSE